MMTKKPMPNGRWKLEQHLQELERGACDHMLTYDAYEKIAMFGSRGSGKTTELNCAAVGRFVVSYHEGLVLVSKNDKAERLRKIRRLAMRVVHLIVADDERWFQFSLLDVLLELQRRRALATKNMVAMLDAAMGVANRASANKPKRDQELFWEMARRRYAPWVIAINTYELSSVADEHMLAPAKAGDA